MGGLVRNISSELHGVLIMLTSTTVGARGVRAGGSGSASPSPEEVRTDRDLVKAVTDFERRVTAWEHESKDALSNLLKIGVVIKSLEKGGFREHLLISKAGTRLPNFFLEGDRQSRIGV